MPPLLWHRMGHVTPEITAGAGQARLCPQSSSEGFAACLPPACSTQAGRLTAPLPGSIHRATPAFRSCLSQIIQLHRTDLLKRSISGHEAQEEAPFIKRGAEDSRGHSSCLCHPQEHGRLGSRVVLSLWSWLQVRAQTHCTPQPCAVRAANTSGQATPGPH